MQEPTLGPSASEGQGMYNGILRKYTWGQERPPTSYLPVGSSYHPYPMDGLIPFHMCQSPEVTAPSLGKSQCLTLVAGVQLLSSRLSPAVPTTLPLTLGKAQLKQHPAMYAEHCPALPWGFMLPRVCSYPVGMEE